MTLAANFGPGFDISGDRFEEPPESKLENLASVKPAPHSFCLNLDVLNAFESTEWLNRVPNKSTSGVKNGAGVPRVAGLDHGKGWPFPAFACCIRVPSSMIGVRAGIRWPGLATSLTLFIREVVGRLRSDFSRRSA